MSRAAETLTGWSAAEAAGHDLADVLRVSMPGRPRALRDSETATSGGTAEGVLLTRDACQVPVEEVSTPIRDDGGTAIGIVIALRVLEADPAGKRRKDRLPHP